MKLILSDIVWFAPGAPKNMNTGLPEQLIIDDPILVTHLLENVDKDKTNIREWLATEYGCCVSTFSMNIEGVGQNG